MNLTRHRQGLLGAAGPVRHRLAVYGDNVGIDLVMHACSHAPINCFVSLGWMSPSTRLTASAYRDYLLFQGSPELCWVAFQNVNASLDAVPRGYLTKSERPSVMATTARIPSWR